MWAESHAHHDFFRMRVLRVKIADYCARMKRVVRNSRSQFVEEPMSENQPSREQDQVGPATEAPGQVVAIQEDDNVFLPDGIENPPVFRTLERIKKRRQHVERQKPQNSGARSQPKVGRNEP
jgi:hypothetical protein